MAMLLYEKLSISNEVIEKANGIANDLAEQFGRQDYASYPIMVVDKNYAFMLHEKRMGIQLLEPIWGMIEHVTCTCYYVDKPSDAQWVKVNNIYSVENKWVNVTLVQTTKELNIEWLKTLLYHEFEHAFQLSKKKDVTIEDVYEKALYWSKNSEPNILLHAMSNLFYYLNKKEVDANMHALYGDLKDKKMNGTSDVDEIVTLVKQWLNTFNNANKSSQDYLEVIELLGLHNYKPSKIKWYLNHQFEYMMYKIDKVKQLVQQETINEQCSTPHIKKPYVR